MTLGDCAARARAVGELMSEMLISAFAVAVAFASFTFTPAAPFDSRSDVAASKEALGATVDIDLAFADVEAASNLDPETADAIRGALYRNALKRINAITYADWAAANDVGGH
jgi:hypothetical protein